MMDEFSSMVKRKEFHAFPLASHVSHARAFLYEHIVSEHSDFYTTIVMSGEQRGTGK